MTRCTHSPLTSDITHGLPIIELAVCRIAAQPTDWIYAGLAEAFCDGGTWSAGLNEISNVRTFIYVCYCLSILNCAFLLRNSPSLSIPY